MLQLKWLPVSEHTGFLVAKLAWKSVNNSDWPKFLPIKVRAPTQTRGGNQEALLVPTCNIENTFVACAPKTFNELPQDVRRCGEYKVFLKKTKKKFHKVSLPITLLNLHFNRLCFVMFLLSQNLFPIPI